MYGLINKVAICSLWKGEGNNERKMEVRGIVLGMLSGDALENIAKLLLFGETILNKEVLIKSIWQEKI